MSVLKHDNKWENILNSLQTKVLNVGEDENIGEKEGDLRGVGFELKISVRTHDFLNKYIP